MARPPPSEQLLVGGLRQIYLYIFPTTISPTVEATSLSTLLILPSVVTVRCVLFDLHLTNLRSIGT